ncbi:MAG: AMP-binding protein [Anaerolineaceae bacterium]|nr:AMP-binding protein [Anaerolineaceae bacterium]
MALPDKINHNIGYLCTDWQVLLGHGDKPALIWISYGRDEKRISFKDLMFQSNRAANLFSKYRINVGDKMMILLPRIPELFTLFLGGLKVGINCCILFTSIGEDTLKERIDDSGTKCIITSKKYLYKIEKILSNLSKTPTVFIIDSSDSTSKFIGIQKEISEISPDFDTPNIDIGQPSHFHFTSGSTGRPKGVQHLHGAITNIADSFMEVFQPSPEDVYWCTADPGWVTGVSYGIIGPWVNGITQIQAEGNYNAEYWMNILEGNYVNILYSAPTVFRMLMQNNDSFYSRFNLMKLKRIYCVGEPLNPAIIDWGRKVLGKDIHDTWFQTETGSIMIANRPGIDIRPGSMGKPLSYINPSILDDNGHSVPPLQKGLLCLKKPWSSMFSEYMKNSKSYQEKFIGDYYITGDIAYTDKDGYFWFVGRNDDVINTAGHLVSPFEVESALLELTEVLDVGVVGVPDEVLYEKTIAFVVINDSIKDIRIADMKLKLHVSQKVSSIASPKEIVFTDIIPKTKSGKIMRRVLRSKYLNEDLGDLSTLEEY